MTKPPEQSLLIFMKTSDPVKIKLLDKMHAAALEMERWLRRLGRCSTALTRVRRRLARLRNLLAKREEEVEG